MASYEVVGTGAAWHLKQDGEPIGNYPSKEAAFEAAVAAASLAIREGHEVRLKRPGSIGWKPNCTRREVLSTPLRLAFGRRAVTAT